MQGHGKEADEQDDDEGFLDGEAHEMILY